MQIGTTQRGGITLFNAAGDATNMCLAMPGKILKIKGDTATIGYPGQTREAKIIEGEYKPGDYVFVSAQIIVQKLPKEEALISLKAWEEAIKNAA